MPSIVDPAHGQGGAWTVTRGLMGMLKDVYPEAQIDVAALREWTGLARRWRQAASVARGLTGPLPAKVAYAVDEELRAKLTPADLAVINGSDLLWTLPYLPEGMPAVVVALNLEHRLFAEQARRLGAFARPEIARYREYELDGLARAGRVIFLSNEEREWAVRERAGLRTMVLPPVFLYEGNRRRPTGSGDVELLMVANMGWWPNVEGLEWFLRHVWPAAPANVRLHVCGPGSEGAVRGVARITGHGLVEDLRPFWENAHAMIAPILRGAGVKIKVAEALYNGVPVLATPCAARGLVSTDGICVRDGAAEWISFLRSGELRDWAARPVPEEARARYSRESGSALLRGFLENG